MEINKALNVAFTVDGKEGPVTVHATPISEAAFRHHYLLIAKVYAKITEERLHTAGPRIAALLAEKEAEEMGNPQAAQDFFSEIRRTTHVFATHGGELIPLPLQVAVDRGVLEADGASEVENLLAFFTSFSAMLPRKLQREFSEGVASACSGRTTPLTSTEYAASLRM